MTDTAEYQMYRARALGMSTDAVGDNDAFTAVVIKLHRQKDYYEDFCKAAGTYTEYERTFVSGCNRQLAAKTGAVTRKQNAFKNAQITLTNSGNGGIIKTGSGRVSAILAEHELEYGVPYGKYAVNANMNYINSEEFAKKFKNITETKAVNETLLKCARSAIVHRNGTLYEDMYLINGNNGEIMAEQLNSECEKGITYNDSIKAALARAKDENIPLIALHSHPEGYPPSVDDFNKAYENNYLLGVVAGHNGQIYVYNAPGIFVEDTEGVQEDIAFAHCSGFDIDRAYQETFINYGLKYFIAKE